MSINLEDMYPTIPGDYLDVLQEDGLSLFKQTLQKRWDDLPVLTTNASYEEKSRYTSLQYRLEALAEEKNDSAAVIKLREKIATDLYDFRNLVELCLSAEDFDAAARWLERCRKHSSGDRYESKALKNLEVEFLRATKNWQQAINIQWESFSSSKDIEDYRYCIQLLQEAGRENDISDYYQRAEKLLKAYLKNTTTTWDGPPASKLFALYLENKDYTSAWSLAQKNKIAVPYLLKLAFILLDEPEKAFPLFKRVIEATVKQGNNNSYRDAINILKEIEEKVSTTNGKKALHELIEHLHTTFRIKRNFITWLNEAFE